MISETEKALDFVHYMLSKGCKPDVMTYKTPINGLYKIEKTLVFVDVMKIQRA